MNKERVIGKVSATEKYPSTTDDFYFWTDKGEILSPFDIIKVKHLPNDETTTYGVIEEINHIIGSLEQYRDAIANNDVKQLHDLLKEGRELKELSNDQNK